MHFLGLVEAGKRGRKASAHALSVAAEAVVRDAITDLYLQMENAAACRIC